MKTKTIKLAAAFLIGTAASVLSVAAQPSEGVTESANATEQTAPASGDATADLAKKLSNPIASLISVPAKLGYDEGFGPKDAGRTTLTVQPVIPVGLSEHWNVISRTIFPIIDQQSVAPGVDDEFGNGDITQSFFFSPVEPVGGWIVGLGPVFLLPTASDASLGSQQFGAGPTAVALRQDGGFTYGMLANHIWGLEDSDDHADVNSSLMQPFVSYNWPTATTLGLKSESVYDWTAEEWSVPISLTVSQILPIAGQPVQFSLGGRHWADTPDGGPEWGAELGITLLFPK